MAIFEKLVSRAKVRERAAETGLRAEQYSDNVRSIESVVSASNLIDANDMVSISGMAEHHQNCACAALLHEDSDALAEHLSKAVHLRALLARFYAAIPVLDTGVIALSYNASTALDLTAPTMLGDWPQGETCAKVLLSAGESEMARDPGHRRTHSWGRGTVAAFIIEFLASEYRLSHRYSPQVPLASEYVKLLSAFRETNKDVYEPRGQVHFFRSEPDPAVDAAKRINYPPRIHFVRNCSATAHRYAGIPDSARRRPQGKTQRSHRPIRDHATSGNRDNNLSKVIGYSRTRMPVALWIALAMAAPTPHRPSSPTPLAFIGDEIGSVSSRKITS